MQRIEKTVFISYRRTNASWVLAIYQYLKHEGYDVFYDYSGIPSGDFECAILENIRARAHFLVLLTPSALERCDEPGDWLRREIEAAMDAKRNIVPLMAESFDFDTPTVNQRLNGKLAALRKYNGVRLPIEYFQEAMTKLRKQFLNIPLDAVVHPSSELARNTAQAQQQAAAAAPLVGEKELAAQDWFEKGFRATDPNERILFYSKSIGLMDSFPPAYYNRGNAYREIGEMENALSDYNKAVSLSPDYVLALGNRGNVHFIQGNIEKARADYDKAISLDANSIIGHWGKGKILATQNKKGDALTEFDKVVAIAPNILEVRITRGKMRFDTKDFDGALDDFTYAIQCSPDKSAGYLSRGNVFAAQGKQNEALADFTKAIRLWDYWINGMVELAGIHHNRALAYLATGDNEGAQADMMKRDRITALIQLLKP